ncbi:MAG: FAD:protein FMN transferase [Haliscomenobacteraceae bacterium CHB4]|nr:FAD:protein FMN transferase [Haliscomenobacteraceae bacterium CHB4]
MLREFCREARLMGSAFELIVVATETRGEALLDSGIREVQRLEKLLTEFSDDSQTALLNQAAGRSPVAVDAETFALLQRCITLSRLTQGAFDITAGVLKKLYNFKGGQVVWPDPGMLEQTLQKVGFQYIQLFQDQRVSLEKPGMRIGFGAIGKGYAADRVKVLWQKAGVEGAVVNASGDLTAWGMRADGSPWKVGIADPGNPARILLWLPVNGVSVATSGDYEQFFERDGVRYSHNIDPKTGLPVRGVKSVTVVSRSAELSDALATAVFVMGPEVGLYFIGQLPETHCVIVDANNKLHISGNLKIN